MQSDVLAAVETLLDGNSPDSSTIAAAFGAVMDGQCSEIDVAALLTGLAVVGETVDELVGAAQAMRDRCTRIPARRTGLLDTCGTGGDKLHTFNISTATAIVVAAAGVPVAKHGNRSVSSSSGSADVLEALGVNIERTPEEVGHSIDEIGLGFCFARLLHSAMKYVAPVRAQLGFRTIFNLLGPLTNPAGAEYQLIGANRTTIAEKLAGTMAHLGTGRTLVVCGADQLDEVALWGETVLFDVKDGEVTRRVWNAAMLGLDECTPDDLRVSSAGESASVIREVLDRRPGPARDIVVANAAAALMATGRCETPQQGAAVAAETIESGKAAAKLEQLIAVSNRKSGEGC